MESVTLQLEEEIEEFKKENENLKSEVSKLKFSYNNAHESAIKFSGDLSKALTDVDKLHLKVVSLEKEKKKHFLEKENLEAKLSDTEDDVERLREKLEICESCQDNLRKEKDKIHNEKMQQFSEFSEIRENYISKIANLEDSINFLTNENTEILDEKDELEDIIVFQAITIHKLAKEK